MSDSSYDMRKKLLELQNELLRNSSDSSYPAPSPKSSPSQQFEDIDTSEVKTILKELLENQQLMLKILMELRNKLK